MGTTAKGQPDVNLQRVTILAGKTYKAKQTNKLIMSNKLNPPPKQVTIKETADKGEMSFNGFDWLVTKAERDQARYIAAECAIMTFLNLPWYKQLFRGPAFLQAFMESRFGL